MFECMDKIKLCKLYICDVRMCGQLLKCGNDDLKAKILPPSNSKVEIKENKFLIDMVVSCSSKFDTFQQDVVWDFKLDYITM